MRSSPTGSTSPQTYAATGSQAPSRRGSLVDKSHARAARIRGGFDVSGGVVPGHHLQVAPLARSFAQRVAAFFECLALLGRECAGLEQQLVGRELVMEARRADDVLRVPAVHEVQRAED